MPSSRSLRSAFPALLFLLDCSATTPARPAATPSTATTEASVSRDVMRGHDARGSAMRDAIARADLDAAKKEADALAQLPFDVDRDPARQTNVNAMKAALSRVSQATDLAEASRGLAAVARSCGDCHTAFDVPSFILSSPPHRGMHVSHRMHRHQWASARLWDGLVAPSDHMWNEAAHVLQDAPLTPERVSRGRSIEDPAIIGRLAAHVHTLGEKAAVTRTRPGREAIYAELLTTCAACHVRLGGGP